MAKLTLKAKPTFKAKVAIPTPGEEEFDPVEFTFKHRTRDEMDEYLKSVNELKDAALIMSVASAWELADEFNEKNLNDFSQDYIMAPNAVFEKYLDELVKARTKN